MKQRLPLAAAMSCLVSGTAHGGEIAPGVAPLGANGGPTKTRGPCHDSPAIEAAGACAAPGGGPAGAAA